MRCTALQSDDKFAIFHGLGGGIAVRARIKWRRQVKEATRIVNNQTPTYEIERTAPLEAASLRNRVRTV